MELTHGSLFSGIGGFDLGFERAGFRSLWQVEIDPYALRVLEKNFPGARRYTDVRSVHGALAHAERVREQQPQGDHPEGGRRTGDRCSSCLPTPTVLTGGFPCQPFSVAGQRRGTQDDRHLWPHMRRLIDEIRPRWVVAENVPGLITMALDEVLSDLEALGYACGTVTLPACAVDAPHRRDRLWIVGHAEQQPDGRLHGGWKDQTAPAIPAGPSEDVAHAGRADGQGARARPEQGGRAESPDGDWWLPEPDLGRVAHGVPHRVDRLRALGNAVVPEIPEAIAWMIREVEGV